jgi:hypothetical protein
MSAISSARFEPYVHLPHIPPSIDFNDLNALVTEMDNNRWVKYDGSSRVQLYQRLGSIFTDPKDLDSLGERVYGKKLYLLSAVRRGSAPWEFASELLHKLDSGGKIGSQFQPPLKNLHAALKQIRDDLALPAPLPASAPAMPQPTGLLCGRCVKEIHFDPSSSAIMYFCKEHFKYKFAHLKCDQPQNANRCPFTCEQALAWEIDSLKTAWTVIAEAFEHVGKSYKTIEASYKAVEESWGGAETQLEKITEQLEKTRQENEQLQYKLLQQLSLALPPAKTDKPSDLWKPDQRNLEEYALTTANGSSHLHSYLIGEIESSGEKQNILLTRFRSTLPNKYCSLLDSNLHILRQFIELGVTKEQLKAATTKAGLNIAVKYI